MGRLQSKRPERAPAGAFARTGLRVVPYGREAEEADARAAERRRIMDILVVEYSYDELQVIAANMRREMERRREVEDIFAALDGYQLYQETCFLYSLKSRDRARFAAERRRRCPVLHSEFRKRENQWRRSRPEEAKARDKRLKAAWYKANAERLKERVRVNRARMKAEQPDVYKSRCARERARAKERPGYIEKRRASDARCYDRVKADPGRWERLRERKRKTKRAWYERNAEYAKEQERQRRRGPGGDELRARDRKRHAEQRDARSIARKAARLSNLEEYRRKARERYARAQGRRAA